ncbi:hypothetical protein [Sulfurimonas sp.]|uniref:hypothetical protein n=1 Tax=Sulfurimonas sp. TaxID=2022749 RepID=UPI0019F6E9C4|nr:hypothetical protein [Sulfurimonas sp.]MBE0515156.1 hypothetical protein [Sulfurimonas sp.]
MALIQEGFVVSYEVLKVGSIKPGRSGEFEGNSYPASLKFRSVNISESEDDVVGLREIEQIIEFSIPCESEMVATNVAEVVRKARNNGEIFSIRGGIPQKQTGADIFKVKSIVSGTDFLKSMTSSKASPVKA